MPQLNLLRTILTASDLAETVAFYKNVIDSFEFAPTDREYNMREFAMRDCNGYTLYFGSDIDPNA